MPNRNNTASSGEEEKQVSANAKPPAQTAANPPKENTLGNNLFKAINGSNKNLSCTRLHQANWRIHKLLGNNKCTLRESSGYIIFHEEQSLKALRNYVAILSGTGLTVELTTTSSVTIPSLIRLKDPLDIIANHSINLPNSNFSLNFFSSATKPNKSFLAGRSPIKDNFIIGDKSKP